MIKEFTVLGLHGERNIKLNFDKNSPYKILVAENGFGKTSLLNLFYGVLSGNLEKILTIDFDEVILILHGNKGKKYSINKDELSKSYLSVFKDAEPMRVLVRRLGEEKALELLDELISNNFRLSKQLMDKARAERILTILIRDLKEIKKIFEENFSTSSPSINKSYNNLIEIKNKFYENILYLPTYRRIEESLVNLYSGEENLDISEFSLNFGMNDVENRLQYLTNQILNSSRSEFLRMNGQMLSQLISIDEIEITQEMIDFIKIKSIDVLLDRIPEEDLSNKIKESIKIILQEEKPEISEHKVLFSFIYNMARADEKQKHNENLIYSYTEICNKYLVNKKIIYDNRKVNVNIILNGNKQKTINIHKLSSGEKQILSLFANLYLSERNDFAIFFDEPELSLSIEWHTMSLKDIIYSKKCKFLFATTHSPFIFDQLIDITSDLSEFSEEIE